MLKQNAGRSTLREYETKQIRKMDFQQPPAANGGVLNKKGKAKCKTFKIELRRKVTSVMSGKHILL